MPLHSCHHPPTACAVQLRCTIAASPSRGHFFGSSDGDSDGEGACGPDPAAVAAARIFAAGGIPEARDVAFDVGVVGPEGAGFAWISAEGDVGGEAALRLALAPTPALLTPEAPPFGVWDAEGSGSDNEGAPVEVRFAGWRRRKCFGCRFSSKS